MKKIITLLLVVALLALPMVSYAAFPDVPEDHWAAQYINELTSKGVINGYTDGNYGPNDTLTNGQFLKLILTASFENPRFEIVEPEFDHWAAVYLKMAQNYHIVNEEDIVINKDNIDEPINRLKVVEILSLCDTKIRRNGQKTMALKFKDTINLNNKEAALLSHAVASNVISGYTDGTFKPGNNLTRAEAAKILSVYMSIK
ncbi:MAG: S-layer homology domain-containing protein [Clostridia bacterium]|nr:S-layer homology domain-containing protein [Clostridia bacterium]